MVKHISELDEAFAGAMALALEVSMQQFVMDYAEALDLCPSCVFYLMKDIMQKVADRAREAERTEH